MRAWWERLSQRPLVAHLLRAIDRFNLRNGQQLSAAIAYFSVLSLVPILMLTFSVLGVTLTVFQPEALRDLLVWVEQQFQGAEELAEEILRVIESALANWATIGLVALAIGFWFGAGWVGNLKRAVRLLMRSDVDNPGKQLPLPLDILSNFAGLVAIFVGIFATFAATSLATTLADLVGRALNLNEDEGWGILLRIITLLVGFIAGTCLFWLLFAWFAPEPVPSTHLWVGAAAGSAGLLILQLLSGFLIQAFSNNLGFSVFGSTLVLMLFLNLFATLILFIACWLATQSAPAEVEEPEPVLEAVPVESKPGQLYVSSKVAEKSLGVGLKTGYAVGTATGVGLGALLVAGVRALFGQRTR